MRELVIGDVHGCIEELDALLARVAPAADDRVVFTGDLIDKGPDPLAVVRRARALPGAVLVEGNHEDRLRRFLVHADRERDGGKAPPIPDADSLRDLAARLDGADREFLARARLWHRLDNGILVVHGGIEPRMRALPDHAEVAALSWNRQRPYRTMQRVRRIDRATGRMVALDAARPDRHPFWAEVYDGRFGHVLFGHAATLARAPQRFPHATGIDLGCVYGGALCAAVVAGASVEFVLVEARRAWAVPLAEQGAP